MVFNRFKKIENSIISMIYFYVCLDLSTILSLLIGVSAYVTDWVLVTLRYAVINYYNKNDHYIRRR